MKESEMLITKDCPGYPDNISRDEMRAKKNLQTASWSQRSASHFPQPVRSTFLVLLRSLAGVLQLSIDGEVVSVDSIELLWCFEAWCSWKCSENVLVPLYCSRGPSPPCCAVFVASGVTVSEKTDAESGSLGRDFRRWSARSTDSSCSLLVHPLWEKQSADLVLLDQTVQLLGLQLLMRALREPWRQYRVDRLSALRLDLPVQSRKAGLS